jgi:SAM-dependent methyltransferase
VTTLDISQSFVKIAQENAKRAGVAVDVRQGNAAAMPFADASFDYVVCMAAFKNFVPPGRRPERDAPGPETEGSGVDLRPSKGRPARGY